jgi:hypothetical protein
MMKSVNIFLSFGLFFLCTLVVPLTAQNWNQIIKAVASDRAAEDNFGINVAISGDYAVVGANSDDENFPGGTTISDVGSAYIFKRTGTNWVQEAKIVANDRAEEDGFGQSVAINGDYVIVGVSYKDGNTASGGVGTDVGAAYIYKRTGTSWAQEAKIVASDRAIDDYFGVSVAINGDYAVVGAPSEDENAVGGARLASAGSAYIFKRTGTSWVQEAKIVASSRAVDQLFGFSVAINGDYVAVGAPGEDENAPGGVIDEAGSAYIFKRTGTSWVQEAKIVSGDSRGGDNFGFYLDISGSSVIVGAPDGDASRSGSAYIFKRTGVSWAKEAKIVSSDKSADDKFGLCVAINGDYAVVGAYSEDENATGGARLAEAGSAYIFKRTGTSWVQESKIVASDRATDDFLVSALILVVIM